MRFLRPTAAEFITWLIVSLLLGSTTFTHGQAPAPVNLSNSLSRPAHGFPEDNAEEPARNFGTGVRVGGTWIDVSRGRMPANLEIAGFYQKALSRTFSVQGEVAYYRQRTTTAATTGGLRLPALLVTNLFTNVSIHLGPQLQWQPATATTPDAFRAEVPQRPTPHLSVAVVAGVEARVSCARIGIRYQADPASLTTPAVAGQRVAHAWNAGLIQAYVGYNIR